METWSQISKSSQAKNPTLVLIKSIIEMKQVKIK